MRLLLGAATALICRRHFQCRVTRSTGFKFHAHHFTDTQITTTLFLVLNCLSFRFIFPSQKYALRLPEYEERVELLLSLHAYTEAAEAAAKVRRYSTRYFKFKYLRLCVSYLVARKAKTISRVYSEPLLL